MRFGRSATPRKRTCQTTERAVRLWRRLDMDGHLCGYQADSFLDGWLPDPRTRENLFQRSGDPPGESRSIDHGRSQGAPGSGRGCIWSRHRLCPTGQDLRAGPKAGRGTRYSPSKCNGADKARIQGNPDPKHISTSFVERQNLNMRMSMRRFTRLTNAFSKKVENLQHALALHFMNYNFVRIHQTLRVTPAMEAGVADTFWTLEDVAALAD